MSEHERTGTNIIQRITDRLTGRTQPHVATSTEGSLVGSVGGFYERAAAWEAMHGREFEIERWENPGRAARYLTSGLCEAHAEPTKH